MNGPLLYDRWSGRQMEKCIKYFFYLKRQIRADFDRSDANSTIEMRGKMMHQEAWISIENGGRWLWLHRSFKQSVVSIQWTFLGLFHLETFSAPKGGGDAVENVICKRRLCGKRLCVAFNADLLAAGCNWWKACWALTCGPKGGQLTSSHFFVCPSPAGHLYLQPCSGHG